MSRKLDTTNVEKILKTGDIESIWVEFVNHHKHILFSLFYQSPNSDANYYTNIENQLAFAVDTGITGILIAGDLNFNLLNPQTARKIESFCIISFHFISLSTNLLIILEIHHH